MLHPIGRNKGRSAADCQRVDWDAIIVGTGMGGATLGLALSQAGKQVLFIEKGKDLEDGNASALRGRAVETHPNYALAPEGSRRELLARAGRTTERYLNVSTGRSVLPEVGSGTGGSTTLFGMVLERFFPQDFTPRAHHDEAEGSSLPEAWPVGYDTFAPWYRKAEELFRVRGTADPSRPWNDAALLPPESLGPGAAALFDRIAAAGLRPYRLPLACESRPDCQSCQGYICDRSCKNDAGRVALRPALDRFGATLLSECRALGLVADRTQVRGVICAHDDGNITVKGRVVVLAGGALQTPRLLLSSRSSNWERGVANASGLVGKNLMRHGIDLWALLGSTRIDSSRDLKALGFNDLYLGGSSGKLGTVQSFGAWPAPEVALGHSPFWRLLGPMLPMIWRRLSTLPVLASILEDLPYPANRVEVDESATEGGLRIHYRPGRSENDRRKEFRAQLRARLKDLGAVLLSGRDAPKALGHACGTCRFGDDPASSVLDRNNRAHGLDNLYVVNASFFPSSAGINPALTIAANALRVGEHIAGRL